MSAIDLTPFGFTPTESRVYEVLLTIGPGTGYAVARSAGLARANAYSALEGLVSKGAARAVEAQPKVFRAEPPASVLARITNTQGQALDQLSRALDGFGAPATLSIIELSSPKGLLQLVTTEIGRAQRSVHLLAPAEAFPIVAPALRRAVSAGLDVTLRAPAEVELPFARVEAVPSTHSWPGSPLIGVFDERSAVIASRDGSEVRGHWSSAPPFVAAARLTFAHFATTP
jgi:HTH-type transcriptional regulator, sugar sensing transcriptional regulator